MNFSIWFFSIQRGLTFYISGEVINKRDRCKTCHGKKVVKENKILEVHIDKGMKDGQKVTFRGEGDQTVTTLRICFFKISFFILLYSFENLVALYI